jgi:hypothetical protein
MTKCKYTKCKRNALAKGYCSKHYRVHFGESYVPEKPRKGKEEPTPLENPYADRLWELKKQLNEAQINLKQQEQMQAMQIGEWEQEKKRLREHYQAETLVLAKQTLDIIYALVRGNK